MATGAASVAVAIAEEDVLRVQFYRFLARFLAAPPDEALLRLSAGLTGDDTDVGRALNALARVAAQATPATAASEYQDLFIGIGRGELLPYGSYYLTGFLNEKPLAKLRQDMAALGIARVEAVKEPEDHIAALCEMMAGLIDGGLGASAGLGEQRTFFQAHLAPWATRFFENLETADSAVLYRPVGTLGRLFMAIEATAFRMEP